MLTVTLAAFSGGILWAILGIGFLIFIHEYGHYTACRLTKTRVETFSIGFGPRLFGWERPKGGKRRFTWGKRQLDPVDHAMDFRVAVIPLGGYVKMAGENPGDVRSGSNDEFSSKSILQRLFIVSAGVIMNAITAFVFYALAFQGGLQQEPSLVGFVEPGSAAWEAGLKTGDRVLEVDGHALTSFTDLRMEAAFLAKNTDRPLVIEREGRKETVRVRARYSEAEGVVHLGLRPSKVLVVGEGPDALRVGPRDRVTVDGVPALGGMEAAQRVADALQAGRETVTVRTPEGRTATVTVRAPKADEKRPEGSLFKMGIRSDGHLVVDAARGAASAVRPGDVLQAVTSGEKRIPIEDLESFGRLTHDVERIDALAVARDGKDVEVPLTGVTDRGAVADFVGDLSFKPAAAVAAIPAGRVYLEAAPFVYVLPVAPAEGKIAKGDRIVKFEGEDVKTFGEVLKLQSERKGGDPIALTVVGADGVKRDVQITPAALELRGIATFREETYKEPLASSGFFDSVGQGAGRLWREVVNTFRTIGGFFTGNIHFAKNVAGPITLVTVSSERSQHSFLDLLWFLAYVSVMLAVLNILPIPVLDGGHVVYLAAEKIRGRPLSDAVIGRMQLVGLLLLLTLMVFAIKNDIKLNF